MHGNFGLFPFLIAILKPTLCLDTRQPGTVFKKLDARQSEIDVQFTRNILLNLCKNIRKLFRKLKRFQILLWA